MSQHPDKVIGAPGTLSPPARQAAQAAAEAAARAGVTVGEIHQVQQLHDAEMLFRTVWGTEPGRAPVNSDVMRALVHAGSYVVAATDADGAILGACVGFLATDAIGHTVAVDSLHSHIAAVAPGLARRGIGSALKLHQRSWAIEHGLQSITWTFDPLVRRNAAFNAHLGATFVRYYPDFYGEMADERNSGQGSDRLLARWALDAEAAAATAADPEDGRGLLVSADAAGRPVPGQPDVNRAWVQTPADIEQIRKHDPELAHSWRIAVRRALRMQPGWRIAGFTPTGRYLLVRTDPTI